MEFLAISVWLPKYKRKHLRGDVIARIALAGLLIPEAIGNAGIAGLPPESGLYATGIGLLAYALFGSSRQLSRLTDVFVACNSGRVRSGLRRGRSQQVRHPAATVSILAGSVFLVATFSSAGICFRIHLQTGPKCDWKWPSLRRGSSAGREGLHTKAGCC